MASDVGEGVALELVVDVGLGKIEVEEGAVVIAAACTITLSSNADSAWSIRVIQETAESGDLLGGLGVSTGGGYHT